MTSINPGMLNRRITVEQQSTTQDGSGQDVSSWTLALSCWASIRVATSKDVYAAAGFVSQISHVVTIRYTPTPITSAMRVCYQGRHLSIQAVSDPDESRVMLQLLCLERDA